ncbi:PH domain-containing protein [Isoptericola sp. S6320L]|uniref:PH domain-containing protein n=1 Tax=Isoptericola sp. S6320L TaxID=2926411 RepID=UPI001FF43BB3|nr:PH domain-containing protein [Isoptericola sp. S6320L]MCK0116367.1 PH domain-containing protein [Isoptericola sp. S6320L]
MSDSGPVPSSASRPAQSPEPPAQQQWRRVHPVTPFVRGWAVIVALLFVVAQQSFDGVPYGEIVDDLARLWWVFALGVLVVLSIVFGYAALAWRMTSYAVDDDAAHLRKGILFRQQRHARLDRLQAVDVRQPLLARIFGLAELTLEVAGGTDSAVAIGFLRLDDATELRADLLARAAGVKARRAGAVTAGTTAPAVATDDSGTAAAPVPDAEAEAPRGSAVAADAPDPAVLGATVPAEAPENQVYEVPPGRLVASLVRLPVVWIILAVLIAVGVGVAATRNFGILFSLLPALLGVGTFLFNRFAGEFGFRAAVSPDGIRLRHGLLETRAQTIPPGRVQAIELTQGIWWRGKDWWRIKVNVAGYGVEGTDTQSVLLPVGPRQEALTALWLVLPDLGTQDPAALVDEGLTGDARTDVSFTTSPRRARILDPLTWRRNGFVVTDRALLLRGGRLTRRLAVVPHERTQSLGLEQGPWQRRRGVASFTVHSTPGPISPAVHHLDAPDAARLIAEQAVRARTARAQQTPERWMETVAAVAAAQSDAQPDTQPDMQPDAGPARPEGDA